MVILTKKQIIAIMQNVLRHVALSIFTIFLFFTSALHTPISDDAQ